jgi:micrococcal nuclease
MRLIGAALLAVAFLVGLDRAWIHPTWTARGPSASQGGSDDFARYDGRAFTVVRVVDGDTLHIDASDHGSSMTKVRLLGIDAPEMAGPENAPARFAREASAFLRGLALGKTVTLYLDEDGRARGTYGRLLAYLALPDGRFLNETLLVGGYAYADWRFDHGYYQRYRRLESTARALNKGLWAQVHREDWPEWRRRMQPE